MTLPWEKTLNSENLVVFIVTLVTWAGVFLYLLRVDAAAKKLEQEVRALEAENEARAVDAAPQTPEPPPISLP